MSEDGPVESGFPRPSPATRASLPSAWGGAALRWERPDVVLCAALAATVSGLVALEVPKGGDLAAHIYRTGLVQHGILVWDNLWFAGDYPLSSYSLLYYPIAAVVGNTALGIAGVGLAAALFASVLHREWRGVGRWPALAFAILLAGQMFTAAYPFTLGLVALLATLWALQRHLVWLALPGVLLTLGFSPLAFLFLMLALVAVFLPGRRVTRQAIAVGLTAALAGGLQLALLLLLPTPGLVFPYGGWRLFAGLAVSGLGIALSLRGRAGWRLASLFAVWAASSVVFEFVQSPIGRNILRVSVFAFPLMLVAAALADWRPRRLAITATVAALAGTVLPYTAMISDRSSNAGSRAAFWQPVISYLRAHNPPGFRVEVVETANHWENYYLPHAGFALARGWYVQLDIADNRVLYTAGLTGRRYRSWLRERAVRYVVLPNLPAEAAYGGQEASLLRSGLSGLRRVWTGPQASLYELAKATPLLTGPGAASISVLQSSRIEGRVGQAGVYLLRSQFNPYWTVGESPLCLMPDGAGATRLEAFRAGAFDIQAVESPAQLFLMILNGHSATCGPRGLPGRGAGT